MGRVPSDLCQLDVSLQSDKSGDGDEAGLLRHPSHRDRGHTVLLNGRPLFLRGTLECCIFPLTGYPPTDVESWKRIIRVCKSHGLNHIRFHSWCPPEAAFVAADELGFYYQVECSTWPNASTSLGNGLPIDEWLYREGERVLEEYGNHPSFLLLAMGNEPAGPERGGKYLGPWVEHFKAKTDRQLVTSGSGWPSIAENEFHVTPSPRIQQWGQGLGSRINAQPPATMADYREFVGGYDVPVISHEIGQWCVYPNFDEMEKYTRCPQAAELRDLPRPARRSPHVRPGPRLPDGLGKAAGAVLQGRNRIGPAHAGFRRLSAVGSARFPGPGNGVGRSARSVLGFQTVRELPTSSVVFVAPPFRWRGCRSEPGPATRRWSRISRSRISGPERCRRQHPAGSVTAAGNEVESGLLAETRHSHRRAQADLAASSCRWSNSTEPPSLRLDIVLDDGDQVRLTAGMSGFIQSGCETDDASAEVLVTAELDGDAVA